jgi:hypothetical protein
VASCCGNKIFGLLGSAILDLTTYKMIASKIHTATVILVDEIE